MINPNENYLVIGASNNKEKYGYKVFYDLISNGYKAIPINPNEKEILNKKTYPNIESFKENIDNIIFVTKPEVTENIIKKIIMLKNKPKKIRLQPGSENNNVLNICKKNNLIYIHDACIMIARKT